MPRPSVPFPWPTAPPATVAEGVFEGVHLVVARGDMCDGGPLDCLVCGPISFRNPLGRLGWDRGYIGAGLAWEVTSRCPPELYRPRGGTTSVIEPPRTA